MDDEGRAAGGSWIRVRGVVVPGHGVASGQAVDPRFPGGTLALQFPHFEAAGLDLSPFHRATINLSIHPRRLVPRRPFRVFRQVRWHDTAPPEDFSFFTCRLRRPPREPVAGLIYYPHPETKPEHFQDPCTVEILAPRFPGLSYADVLELELRSEEVSLVPA